MGANCPVDTGSRPDVEGFCDPATNTIFYIVKDPNSNACAVVDSVLDFDQPSGLTAKDGADRIIARVKERDLAVEWLIETHVHADHLSAAPYIQQELGGKLGIGARIVEVQDILDKVCNAGTEFERNGSQFDRLFEDGDTYTIGGMTALAMATPGHTPACMTHVVGYDRLVVCPGLKLDWERVEGLEDTLGKNGVTSNYRFDLAPYAWTLVRDMKRGTALSTQPPMPIKCAGAPQKAMYLSADHWLRAGVLDEISVEFLNAGAVLFGVKEFVPALMDYVERYRAKLSFQHDLKAVDGPARTAWFEVADSDGNTTTVERRFDMLHVCPPQAAPDFIRVSPLANAAGWVDVDQSTLRHRRYDNVYSLGDVMNAPNAKTAAAARKQAPTVAENLLHDMGRAKTVAHDDGYGSCPLTVERGKIVLAEFGYGGKLLPSFPAWILDGTKPSRTAWLLKERIMPPLYWQGMLKGREWLAQPERVTAALPS